MKQKRYYEDYLRELMKTIGFEFKKKRKYTEFALNSKSMQRILAILHFYNIDMELVRRLHEADEIRQFSKLDDLTRLVLGIKHDRNRTIIGKTGDN